MVEFVRDAPLQVRAVHRVLLHLAKDVTLENEADELIMCLLQAVKVLVEHRVIRLDHLQLSQGKRSIKPILEVVELEYVFVYLIDTETVDQLRQLVVTDGQVRVG